MVVPNLRALTARRNSIALSALVFWLAMLAVPLAAQPAHRGRLVILMVWDGLRPDSVTQSTTPNLYALTQQGVYFAANHSMYPSLTMVNAAALATGAPPGANGIVGNAMYFAHVLSAAPSSTGALARVRTMPVSLENPQILAALNSPGALDGNLVPIQSLAEQTLRGGGFVGVVGKTGPTFMFDDRVSGRDSSAREIFVSDDRISPPSLAQRLWPPLDLAGFAAAFHQDPPMGDQDKRLAGVFIDHVIPAAAAALRANRSALLVFWQHNPDATEHAAGLGTAAFEHALQICDANLGRLRAALAKAQLEDQTDLIVVSDHGFATVKMRVELADLLVSQGLKKSKTSDDVVVAHNFGSDAIYLSPGIRGAARARLMRKIVEYAAAQPWCGAIFSRAAAGSTGRYAGEIAGTFDQAWFGLLNPGRSADLVISFREMAQEDNSKLTGPQAPATVLGAAGVRKEPNRSQPLIHPMKGVAYADSNARITTGNGTHGALGEFETHNFGAAAGPDFRNRYVDHAPTSNIDIARTIGLLLDLPYIAPPAQPASATGRVLKEALRAGSPPPRYRRVPLSVALDLTGRRIVTSIEADQIEGKLYPARVSVTSTSVKPAMSAPIRPQ